jgi:hypothetical protein
MKLNLRKVESEDMDWMNVAQDRDQFPSVVRTVTKFWVPETKRDFLNS